MPSPNLASYPPPLIPKLEMATRPCVSNRATSCRILETFAVFLWNKDRSSKERPSLIDLKDFSGLKFLTLTSVGFDRRQKVCCEARTSSLSLCGEKFLRLTRGQQQVCWLQEALWQRCPAQVWPWLGVLSPGSRRPVFRALVRLFSPLSRQKGATKTGFNLQSQVLHYTLQAPPSKV